MDATKGAPEGALGWKVRVGLEVDLHGQLGLAGRVGRVYCGYFAKGATSVGAGRVRELRVIEDVIALHAELEADDAILREDEVLGEDHVGVVDAGAMVGIAVDVAEGADVL